jgi:D-sedoheptulose 7-phosphate isomerase
MDYSELIKSHVKESIDAKSRILNDENLISVISKVAEICTDAYKHGHKTLFAGNGGSAADAQHLAGEMVSRFYFDRPGIPSVALTTDSSIMTAIGNDYSFDKLFSRQIQAQGSKGDVFIGISTSGNSKNLVEALPVCRDKGIISVAFTGERPCKMDDYDYVVKIPSSDTPRIQECETLIGHIICCIVEQNLFGEKK